MLKALGKVKQPAKFEHRISMHHGVMRIRYVFSIGFPLYVPKNEVFGGFEGEDVKLLSSNPQKALPCVNTRLLMYRVTKSVHRPEL